MKLIDIRLTVRVPESLSETDCNAVLESLKYLDWESMLPIPVRLREKVSVDVTKE